MELPTVGDRLPRQGNRATRALGRGLLRLLRWRVEGQLPDREKVLAIAAPHTTGWDFGIALVALLAIGVRVSWMGADWVVRLPFMRAIGGISVNRASRSGMVPQLVAKFTEARRFVLGLSPEGSRKKVTPWKTGFYHIATGARVPILLIALDQKHKRIEIGPLIQPTGSFETDMETQIKPFFARFLDQVPDRFGF